MKFVETGAAIGIWDGGGGKVVEIPSGGRNLRLAG